MNLRACTSLLPFVSACATSGPGPTESVSRDPRIVNLQRAATLPWTDGGRCAVQEASRPWPVLAERCYQALDHDRVEFHDTTGRCMLSSVGAAVVGFGVCVLAAPEIALGAVIVTGGVVVGFAIQEALDAYESTRNAPSGELQTKRRRKPKPEGPDIPPPWPPGLSEQERRSRCEPIPVKHRGGDDAHDRCADMFPPNRYPGMDVLVDGKHFDALQVGARVLWEIKTDQFGTYSDFLRGQVISAQVEELRAERDIATSCGYGFVVGVSTEEHKEALEFQALDLQIVVTGCPR
ncbi:DUF6310 domain-containing protein [Melittangium boletus]|uniref:DUF6310 domain-containing protein n=1 Tax=Melittangium boletus TaxID=83453 RepID=UPI003DA369F7